MNWDELGLKKYAPLLVAALLAGGWPVAAAQAPQATQLPRRSDRRDQGPRRDHRRSRSGATEEALARLQESLDELRGRLPELNRKRLDKRRKEINKRLGRTKRSGPGPAQGRAVEQYLQPLVCRGSKER